MENIIAPGAVLTEYKDYLISLGFSADCALSEFKKSHPIHGDYSISLTEGNNNSTLFHSWQISGEQHIDIINGILIYNVDQLKFCVENTSLWWRIAN